MTENVYETILSGMDSGIVVIDEEARITYCNVAVKRIFGMEPRSLYGKKYKAVFSQRYKNGSFPILETLRHGKEFKERHGYLLHGDDAQPVSCTTKVLKDKNGEITGAAEIISDMHLPKKLEYQLYQTKTIQALGEMAGIIAHEIRNPLGAIGGFAGLLEREFDDKDPKKDMASKIIKGVSGLNRIVSNLLLFTRPLELNVKNVELVPWLEEIIRLAKIESEKEDKKIIFDKNLDLGEVEICIDPEKFQQAMMNLLLNSIQAIAKEGIIKITMALDTREILIVSIWDNGRGIPSGNIHRLFNPFFTTRENGTGLGLAIVRKIVGMHGGKIDVNSKEGEYSCFTLSFGFSGADNG